MNSKDVIITNNQGTVRGGKFRTRPHADGLTGETREMQEKRTPAKQLLAYSDFHHNNVVDFLYYH